MHTRSLVAVVSLLLAATAGAQTVDTSLFRGLEWRMIGPFRGGRTKAAAGIPSQPSTFYIGVVNGGVWKTTDAGRVWTPIFDDQPTGSIGAIAIAPSDPNTIYVGSGEGLQRPDLSTGDGIYKSTDAGKSWMHLGLRDGQQIPQIIVDPRNPNRLFVAVLGHPYGPNAERGIFRSTDGGRSFEKVLYKDENTGGVDVVFDPSNADIVYAVLWEARQGPWENGAFTGPGSGLFKSIDGGTTWRQVGKGIPGFDQGLGRIGITVAPSMPSRMFATVELRGQGYVYRSDDAGENWYRVTEDTRIASRPSDFAEVKVDPKNPDIVYSASVVTWKSTDGGKSWVAFRGAPGGDDYHRIWINPNDSRIILIAADQGAIITLNGGETWSSWYNQPSAQFYHVIADNAFPYRVCGGQQESGSACVQSRSDEGRISFREWRPVGIEEYGYAAPDPRNPDVIYGGKLTRFNWNTHQTENIAPRPLRNSIDYRVLRTMPVVFSQADNRTLFYSSNVVWKTTTYGDSWTKISPDLTRTDSVVPANVGKYATTPAARSRHPGVIYTLAPSPRDVNLLWAGTDDGLIHVTRNGGRTWSNVTPPMLTPWAKVSLIDASHFDANTAYAAINTLRLDDLRPHILRTRDGGRTWTEIVSGIPDGATINAVREDPVRKGLLFAGSERQVYVSFDDGDHWSSLRLNAPVTSIRDLWIKDNDLLAGTHGRGFWILDDISRLRQLSVAPSATHLFKPSPAWRFRWNKNTDTPLPPDEPTAPNGPDGAVIDYYITGNGSETPVAIDILDNAGTVIRHFSSTDTAQAPADIGNIPRWWIRPTQVPSATSGMHRFVWDLHYDYPPVAQFSYPISATPEDTPREPRGALALPGTYTVRLSYAGRSLTQPLTVKMDPRVKTPAAGLRRQFTLSQQVVAALGRARSTTEALRGARSRYRDAKGGSTGPASAPSDSLESQLSALEGSGGRFGGGASAQPSLGSVTGDLETLFGVLQEADAAPTQQLEAAVAQKLAELDTLVRRWQSLSGRLR